ncbi:hypothetical protein [Streptomyces sp. NBC_01353]|uniref:hypothetical protein n=1 Tax=Streptomyces sp. NBC_01353 TaxID=2903835 RepID=UPI002E35742D|nr:hypothetical protein [Streptomyces sp. NBC_01353]
MTTPHAESAASFAWLTGAYWLERPDHRDAECASCSRLTSPDARQPSQAAAVTRLAMLITAGGSIGAGLVSVVRG